jgi:glucosamine-6-phosphate deaminase
MIMASPTAPQQTLQVGSLQVEQYADRAGMGAAAAQAVAERMRAIIASRGSVTVVFAAAPSQNEFLATLVPARGIAWEKVVAFHMDEYIGLPADAPQGFGNFLRQKLFDRVKPGTVLYLNGQAPDPEQECRRYAALLQAHPVDIVCAGIGENGHLAFNDPPVADFADPFAVKVVDLDHTCRMQQVHDGCFSDLDSVPTHALTMTIPALVAARWIYTIVPGPTKAQAIKDTLTGPIGTHCPATILRRHPRAILYTDRDSASLL